MSSSAGFWGPLFAFLASVTWAIGSASYSKLARRHSPFAVNFTRALFAVPLFLLGAFIAAGSWSGGLSRFAELGWDKVGWFTLSMTASYGLGDACFLLSTHALGVPGALAVASIYPIYTAALGTDPLGSWQWIGMLITVFGAIFVILNGPEQVGHARTTSRVRGVALALATSVFWAINSYAVSRGGAGLDAHVGNALRLTLAMAITLGLGKFFGAKGFMIPLREVRGLWWIFVIEAYAGSLFFMLGFKLSPLPVAATLASLAPVIAVPVAWLLGLEKFSLLRTIGIIFVIAGVTLLVTNGSF